MDVSAGSSGKQGGGSSFTSSEGDRPTGNLIVVSNRLPVSLSKAEDDSWNLKKSSGGLVAAMNGVKLNKPFLWIGWPGADIPMDEREGLTESLEAKNCVPVFLDEKTQDLHYNGFSNSVLWPLFHYQHLPQEGEKEGFLDMWEGYRRANRAFADVILSIYQPGDTVWIHDYHLMLLPLFLREKQPDIRLGWFLHTPFPSSEFYRMLPKREEILLGILACDLVGFHTFDYARHFQSCCSRILGMDTNPKGVATNGRFVTTAILPIGIDPDMWLHLLEKQVVQTRIQELTRSFEGKVVILGVDRLDYIKGVPHKMWALERFFTMHPEFASKVVMVQIAVPTRDDVPEYQRLKKDVNELVGRINSHFGSVDNTPIHYLHKSVPQPELCALYDVADICFVSSLRDGMNLVSHEFVACQQRKRGVLILSEFAGSSHCLAGAVRVNPWDLDGMAKAIFEAIHLKETERVNRYQNMFNYVSTRTASFWGGSFMKELEEACLRNTHSMLRLQRLPREKLFAAFDRCSHRFIFMDYDGTISALQTIPQLAAPNTQLLSMVHKLASDPNTHLCIVSGRRRVLLDEWFAEVSDEVALVAENGSFFKLPGQGWEMSATMPGESWKDIIRPVFELSCDRTPGSFIDEKESCISWHYRFCDAEYGEWQSRELEEHLSEVLKNTMPLRIVSSPKTIEVIPMSISKGVAVQRILEVGLRKVLQQELEAARNSGDMVDVEEVFQHMAAQSVVLCVGDDATDEEMFSVLDPDVANEFAFPEMSLDRVPSLSSSHGGATGFSPQGPSPRSPAGSSAAALESMGSNASSSSEEDFALTPRCPVNLQHAARIIKDASNLFTVTVGRKTTHALYLVDHVGAALDVLRQLGDRSGSSGGN